MTALIFHRTTIDSVWKWEGVWSPGYEHTRVSGERFRDAFPETGPLEWGPTEDLSSFYLVHVPFPGKPVPPRIDKSGGNDYNRYRRCKLWVRNFPPFSEGNVCTNRPGGGSGRPETVSGTVVYGRGPDA